jgi:hypothetical protein
VKKYAPSGRRARIAARYGRNGRGASFSEGNGSGR